jgi:hypothetical protein
LGVDALARGRALFVDRLGILTGHACVPLRHRISSPNPDILQLRRFNDLDLPVA